MHVQKALSSASSYSTRVRYAAPRPLLQSVSPTLCSAIFEITISTADATPSNLWLFSAL